MKVKEIHVTVRQPDDLAADTGVPNVRHLKQVRVETPPEPEPTEPWHTPLQQMLDAIKSRVEPEDDDEIVAVLQPGLIAEDLHVHRGLNFCKDCGALIVPSTLRESIGDRVGTIQRIWQEKTATFVGDLPKCTLKHRI